MFGLICTLFYGYVALDYDSDPESCIATNEYEKRVVFQGTSEEWEGITIDEDKYIDVGERFGRVFDACFYASLVLLISGMIHTVTRHKYARLGARAAVVMAQWTIFVSIIMGLVSRFMHTGKVCSGDYLADDMSTEGYMMTQGLMLSLVLYTWLTVLVMGVCAALIALFLATS